MIFFFLSTITYNSVFLELCVNYEQFFGKMLKLLLLKLTDYEWKYVHAKYLIYLCIITFLLFFLLLSITDYYLLTYVFFVQLPLISTDQLFIADIYSIIVIFQHKSYRNFNTIKNMRGKYLLSNPWTFILNVFPYDSGNNGRI